VCAENLVRIDMGSNRAACLLVGHQADVPTHLMYVSAFEGGTGSAWSSWALRSGY
jgi:hypothetical protein